MMIRHGKACVLAALIAGIATTSAEAANCEGRRDTGTAVGAIGGGLLGNGLSHGSAGGTIAGAVIGGVAGNVINGSDAPSTSSTVITTGMRSGGDGTHTYTQTSSSSSTTTVQDNGDDDITGAFTRTTTTSDSHSMTETGTGSTTYTLVDTGTSNTTVTATGNWETGSDAPTITGSSASTITETGHDGSSGTFTLTKTVTDNYTQTTTSDDITASYTTTTTDHSTSTATEITSNSTADTTFTETITDNSTTTEIGDSLTGNYTRTITDTTTMTDSDRYVDGSGTVTVAESSTQTVTGTQTGDSITSAYTLSESVSNTYSMTETASNFTLMETGAWTGSIDNEGNTVEGAYTNTTTGQDSYTMTESGTITLGAYYELIYGDETFTQVETGNPANQTYARTIDGSATYSAPAPTLVAPPPSGNYSYETQETADARGGHLNQTQTGTTRYGILERFVDVSNAGNSPSPGNMNFLPYGQAFVDPDYVETSGDRVYWVVTKPVSGFFGGVSDEVVKKVLIGTIAKGGGFWDSDNKTFVKLNSDFKFTKGGFERTIRMTELKQTIERLGHTGPLTNFARNGLLQQALVDTWNMDQAKIEFGRRKANGTLPATLSPENNDTPIQELYSKLAPNDYAMADIAAKHGAPYKVIQPPSKLAVAATPGGTGEQILHSLGGFTGFPGLTPAKFQVPVKGSGMPALRRPNIRTGTEGAIKAAARRAPDGRFLGPDGLPIDGPIEIGHVPGREHWRLVTEALEKGMTQQEFNDWVNSHPEWFRIESRSGNRSHRDEMPPD